MNRESLAVQTQKNTSDAMSFKENDTQEKIEESRG